MNYDLAAMISKVKPADAFKYVFDVGANVGQSIPALRKAFPKALLHCFEPAPVIFADLAAAYPADGIVFTHNIALGNTTAEATITNVPDTSMNRIVNDAGSVRAAKIKMMRMIDFCLAEGIPYINYLKIDTEGNDLEVIKGCAEIAVNIDFIECEVSANVYNTYHVAHSKVFDHMSEVGFYLFHIYDQTREWVNGGYPVLRRFNSVYINKRQVGGLNDLLPLGAPDFR